MSDAYEGLGQCQDFCVSLSSKVLQENFNRSLNRVTRPELLRGVLIFDTVMQNLEGISTSDCRLSWVEGRESDRVVNLPRVSLTLVLGEIHVPVVATALTHHMICDDDHIAYLLTERILGQIFKKAEKIKAICSLRMKQLHDALVDAELAANAGGLRT
jgi:hypothetical protein